MVHPMAIHKLYSFMRQITKGIQEAPPSLWQKWAALDYSIAQRVTSPCFRSMDILGIIRTLLKLKSIHVRPHQLHHNHRIPDKI